MGWKFKSEKDIRDLAVGLKSARLSRGLTLVQLAVETGVNCGQLSRFENGQFQTSSRNLQKIREYLQISVIPSSVTQLDPEESLSLRIERFASISPKHRAVAEQILRALESLA